MKIVRQFFVPTLALIQVTGVFAADETNQWNSKVVAVMVVAPEGGTDNRNFCWKTGATVSVMMSPAKGKIVKVNEQDSKLDSFTDDKGTDLMAAPPSPDPFNKPGISCMLPASDSGYDSMILDLRASGRPAKGATALNISGTVNVEVAGSQKQFTVENVKMETNATFNLGDLPVTISEVGANQNSWASDDYKYSLTFSGPHDFESISSVEFFDAQGNKIQSHKSSWGGGMGSYMIQFEIKQNVDRVKIVATCWQDLKTLDVPVSIKASVGL
jgi:hypothetical protein